MATPSPAVETSSRAVIEDVLAGIPKLYPRGDGPRVVERTVWTRPYSIVARLRLLVEGGEQEVFVKVPFSGDLRKMEHELRALMHYGECFAGRPRYGVVEAVGVLERPPALVTRAAPGRPLNRLVREGARFFSSAATRDRLGRLCRDCGAWLRAFQSFPLHGEGGGDTPQDTVRSLLDKLDRCGERKLLDADTLSGLRREVTRRAEALDRSAVRTTGMHSDFIPSNILAGEQGIRVLDFAGCRPGPWCRDVATFLHGLDGFLTHPLIRPANIDRLKAEFLSGFGWTAREAGREVFDLYVIGETLGGLLQLSKRSRGGLRGWAFERMRRRARRSLAALVAA